MRPRSWPPRIVRGGPSPFSFISAPICLSGSVTRRIGRRRSDASPVSVASKRWPASTPSMSLAVVPEFPQFKRDAGCENRDARTVTRLSVIDEISAPSCRSTRALLFTSSPVSSPVRTLFPRARAASISTRCEMLLSPGGRTTPLTKAAPPGGCPGEPRGERGGITDLERALHRAQRFLERAQRRQDLVAVHEENLGPKLGLAGGQ